MTQHKLNQTMYAQMFKMLLDDPVTTHEVAEETGMHIVTAYRIFRTLKKHKVVHITAWEKDSKGRDTTPVFKLGTGRDKPRAKKSTNERTKEYRERLKVKRLNNILAGGSTWQSETLTRKNAAAERGTTQTKQT